MVWYLYILHIHHITSIMLYCTVRGEYDEAWFEQNLMRIDLAFRHMFEEPLAPLCRNDSGPSVGGTSGYSSWAHGWDS